MSKPQSQVSLIEQLKALYVIANREGLYDAADFLRAKVEAQEAREKAVDNFLTHVAERGPMYDATHVPEQGDDSHYYELDARVVEPVVALLEGPMAVQMGRNDDILDDDRPMGVSLRDD